MGCYLGTFREPFAVTCGDVALTHNGGDYWGIAATGRKLRMRVMDFYRFDEAGRLWKTGCPTTPSV
ncbi:ester cyclase [Jannaschia rubra]|uniref:ester cyclase n=1 Tax=Jannaschia rubra TaxID=282197 RepID=UPI0011874AFA|nr:ester cyclase [Jannaschia rubra]